MTDTPLWTLEVPPSSAFRFRYIVDEDQNVLAEVRDTVAGTETDLRTARTMAASPAMLQALKYLTEWAAYMGGWESEEWTAARRVIKRAETDQ